MRMSFAVAQDNGIKSPAFEFLQGPTVLAFKLIKRRVKSPGGFQGSASQLGDMQSAADGIPLQHKWRFVSFHQVARLSPSVDGMTPDTICFLLHKRQFAKCRPFIFFLFQCLPDFTASSLLLKKKMTVSRDSVLK
jgi:hypothetical protein